MSLEQKLSGLTDEELSRGLLRYRALVDEYTRRPHLSEDQKTAFAMYKRKLRAAERETARRQPKQRKLL